MANQGPSPQMDPSNGGGGSGWERNMSAGPSLQYDSYLGRYVLGYLMEDGRVIPADQMTGPQQESGGSDPGGGSGPSLPIRGLPKVASNPLAQNITPSPSGLTKFVNALGGKNTLASLGVAGVQTYLNNRANNKALDQQAQATDKAMALQKQMYDTTRNDLAPYRTLGTGASAQLGYFLGMPGYEQGNKGIAPEAPQTPANMAVPRTLGDASEPGGVVMRAPDGTTKRVSEKNVSYYEARGAVRV